MMKEEKLFILIFIAGIAAAAALSTTILVSPDEKKIKSVSNYIGVIDIQGPLLSGESSTIGTSTGELERSLEKARLDSQVKAVILRIDSPGGSATASYEMYSMIKRFEKPIVSYGRGIIASGSYLASLGTDNIVVHPFSEVGGVGVYIELERPVPVNFENAEMIEAISSGKLKTLWEDGILDNVERSFLKSKVDEIEKTFQNIVYDEAPLEKPDTEKIQENIENPLYVFSEGGWFNGTEAYHLGLVNELGDFENSVRLASKLAGIDREKAEIIEIETPRPGTFENILYNSGLYRDNKWPEVYLK